MRDAAAFQFILIIALLFAASLEQFNATIVDLRRAALIWPVFILILELGLLRTILRIQLDTIIQGTVLSIGVCVLLDLLDSTGASNLLMELKESTVALDHNRRLIVSCLILHSGIPLQDAGPARLEPYGHESARTRL